MLAARPAGAGRLGRAAGTLVHAGRRGAPASRACAGARARGPGPRLVAGHSQGAAIALALARAEPEIGGLLLSNPVTPEIRSPSVLRLLRYSAVRRVVAGVLAPLHAPLGHLVLRRACGPAFRAPRDLVAAYARPWASSRRARTLLRILADWHPAELAGRMPDRPPAVHVVTGAHDPRIPVETARRLASRLGCDFTVCADGGHVLTEQHPRLLARLLRELAAGLPPDPRHDTRASEA